MKQPRTERLALRLTPKELQRIAFLAADRALSVSAYVRQVALSGTAKQPRQQSQGPVSPTIIIEEY